MSIGTAVKLRQHARRTSQYICWQCQQQRSISQSFLKKKVEGREQWAEWAKEIQAKRRKSMLTILKERGLVHSVAGDETTVDRVMTNKRIGAYVGIDPTAPSLHVGHLLPLMALFWMHLHGYHTVSLLGASTARIGDPTGRTTDRPVMTPTERKANVASMHYQIKRLWVNLERMGAKHGYHREKHWHREVVTNAVWWNKLPFLDVLKVLGKGIRLGTMLSRDTVKTKMDSGDGMSFAEFCYPLMQAWDWWHMYDEKGIQMQIGGSDQFGNIVAGIDAIKYIVKSHTDPDTRQEGGVVETTTPYGFTVPLLTTASGAKFGKSAGNAIWLDQAMTSTFDLYGFFVRSADADVERYLKLFTFLGLPEIQSLMDKHKMDPSKRIPHHRLAREFVDFIHGEEAAIRAEEQHRAMFQKPTLPSITELTEKAQKPNPLALNQNPATQLVAKFINANVNKYAPQSNANSSPPEHLILPKSLVYDQPIARILWAAGLVSSRSEGHRLVENKGAYIGMRASGKQQMKDDLSFVPAKLRDPSQSWSNVIRDDASTGKMEKEGEEGLLILRVGKWKVRVVRIVSDKKFEELGIKGPQAWQEIKSLDAADRQQKGLASMLPKQSGVIAEEPQKGNEQVLEAITAEDNDRLRAELGDVPNPTDGLRHMGQARKEQWTNLLGQQARGRHAYERAALRDIHERQEESNGSNESLSDTSDAEVKSLREGLRDLREYQIRKPLNRSPQSMRDFKSLVGMVDKNPRPRGTQPLDNDNIKNDDPVEQSIFRKVDGDSTFVAPTPRLIRTVQGISTLAPSPETYPPVGRLADLDAEAQKEVVRDGIKTFGGQTKAGKRKLGRGAIKAGYVINSRGGKVLRRARSRIN